MDSERAERQQLFSAQSIKDASLEVRAGFVRKVYAILSFQLLLTAAIATPLQRMPLKWIAANQWMMWVSMVVTIGLICAMTCCGDVARKYPTNYIILFVFTAFEGVLVGFVSAMYTAGSVAICVGITAAIFLGLTVYAWQTKTDFTGMGAYLFGAMLTLCVFGFVMGIMGMCGVHIPWLHMVYDIFAILLFVMYIIFDTQLILGGHKHECSVDDYVFASLALYLDIINLFLHILSLLGERKD